jgi:ADP-heptose:LPS heptosyltransferase
VSGPYRRLEDTRRIAVLRANAIGDLIFALPALDSLRAAYRQAEIVLLGLPWHAEFLSGRPGPIDRVEVVPVYRGIREEGGGAEDVAGQERFFAAMAREHFDLAIQIHGGGRNSNPFVLRLDARVTAGLRTPDAAPLDRWVPYIYYQPEVHRYLEVMALVGARPVGFEPRLRLLPGDLEEAYTAVPEAGPPMVVLHPGAGDPRRHWPTEGFAAVGDALAQAGARVVVIGGRPEERPLVDAVVGGMKSPALNLAGRISLRGLAGLLSRCAVVVGNDSGPLHLAHAVGARTVGVYWCGNVITAGPLTRSRHRLAISWRLNCPVCGADTTRTPCSHHVSFVADVLVDEVLEPALELYQDALHGG